MYKILIFTTKDGNHFVGVLRVAGYVESEQIESAYKEYTEALDKGTEYQYSFIEFCQENYPAYKVANCKEETVLVETDLW